MDDSFIDMFYFPYRTTVECQNWAILCDFTGFVFSEQIELDNSFAVLKWKRIIGRW
jgi:hypothetical protein